MSNGSKSLSKHIWVHGVLSGERGVSLEWIVSLQLVFWILDLGAPLSLVDSLAPFPSLGSNQEEKNTSHRQTPLPSDWVVEEDLVIDNRNVDDWENSNETTNNGPEQELVVPKVDGGLLPPRVVSVLSHVEQGVGWVNTLPSKDKGTPCHGSERSRSASEDQVTAITVTVVTVTAQVSVTITENDNNERKHTTDSHEKTEGKHINDNFLGENVTVWRLF